MCQLGSCSSGPSVGGAFVLGFAGLCHLLLSIVQWDFKSEARLLLRLHSMSHLLRARFIPRSLLLDIPVCYQLRIWGGMKAAPPCTLQGCSSFQLKKKKHQRKEQGNKGKGMFLRGTMGAVHEKGPFQSISFAVKIDLRWSEIIFQIKAMFKKKKPLKNETHNQQKCVIWKYRGIKFR